MSRTAWRHSRAAGGTEGEPYAHHSNRWLTFWLSHVSMAPVDGSETDWRSLVDH